MDNMPMSSMASVPSLSRYVDRLLGHTPYSRNDFGLEGTKMDMGDMSWLGHSASLPQFDTELQKMVADEKLRSEQHKIHYQQLKAEHSKLQDEYVSIQDELKTTVEESRLVQERYRALVDQGKRALLEKHTELEDARTQVFTPQKLELIRMQLTEEIERPYMERLLKSENDLDEVTGNYNKLRYDLSFLTSEYEGEKTQHSQIINEIKLQYEAEVTNLRKERDAVTTKFQTENSQDAQRVRVTQRENTQLTMKNKSLVAELEDVRALREKVTFDMDQLTRSHDKQTTEQAGCIKALEAEKESLKQQMDRMHREFASTASTHERLTNRIHEIEKENVYLRNHGDELVHRHKVDVSNVRMEMLKQRGEVERERDLMANTLEDTTTQLEIAKHTANKLEQLLVEKEKGCVMRVQAVREEEWAKNALLENERLELETKIQEMTRLRLDDDTLKQSVRDRFDERLRAADEVKEVAEREAVMVKAQLTNQERLQRELDDTQMMVSRLKARVHDSESSVATARHTEHEMVEVMTRLKNHNQALVDDARNSRQQLERLQDQARQVSINDRVTWADEKSQNEAHTKELGGDLAACQHKLSSVIKMHKKYKAKCLHVVHNLKNKLQLQKAKLDELRIARKALENFIAPEVYRAVQRQLRDLQKRNTEFRKIIHSGATLPVPIGDLTFSRIVHMPDMCNISANNTVAEDQQHVADIKQLKRRLETLDSFQQQQLDQLRNLTSKSAHKERSTNGTKHSVYSRSYTTKLNGISPVAVKYPSHTSPVHPEVEHWRGEKGDCEKSCKSDGEGSMKEDLYRRDNDESLKLDHLMSPGCEVGVAASAIVETQTRLSSSKTERRSFVTSVEEKKFPSVTSKDEEIASSSMVENFVQSSAKLESYRTKGDHSESEDCDKKMQTEDSHKSGRDDVDIDVKGSNHAEQGVDNTVKSDKEQISEEIEDVSLRSADEYSSKFDDSLSEDKW